MSDQHPNPERNEENTEGEQVRYLVSSLGPTIGDINIQLPFAPQQDIPDELHRKPYNHVTPEQIEEMRTKKDAGISINELATEYNLSSRQIHRLLTNTTPITPKKKKESQLKLVHSAYIFEELLLNPATSNSALAAGLEQYFGLKVSTATIWRHIRSGAMEAHGFPGHTRDASGGYGAITGAANEVAEA